MESTNCDEFEYYIPPEDVNPIKEACYHRLLHLLEERAPEDLLKASTLFRVWYRLHTDCPSKSVYPLHDTWEALARALMEAEGL